MHPSLAPLKSLDFHFPSSSHRGARSSSFCAECHPSNTEPTFYANQITYLRQIVTNHHYIALFFHESFYALFLCVHFFPLLPGFIPGSTTTDGRVRAYLRFHSRYATGHFSRKPTGARKIWSISRKGPAAAGRGGKLCADGMNYCENYSHIGLTTIILTYLHGPRWEYWACWDWRSRAKWRHTYADPIGEGRSDVILLFADYLPTIHIKYDHVYGWRMCRSVWNTICWPGIYLWCWMVRLGSFNGVLVEMWETLRWQKCAIL